MRTDAVDSLVGRVILGLGHLTPLQFHIGKAHGITTTDVNGLARLDRLVHHEGTITATLVFQLYVTAIEQGEFCMQ